VSFISAATPESVEDTIDDNDVYGGLFNRFIPLGSDEMPPPQPWPKAPDRKLGEALRRDIERIQAVCGSPQVLEIHDPTARRTWEAFYIAFSERQRTAPESLAVLTSRLDAHTMKIALLYAALRGGRSIELEDLTRALEVTAYVDQVIETTLRPLGLTASVRLEERIGRLLGERPMTRRELHQRLSGRVKSFDLMRALNTLLELERVVELPDGRLGWTDAMHSSSNQDSKTGGGEDATYRPANGSVDEC